MAFFATKAFKSLFGRQVGIQRLSTAEHGGRLPAHFLVGDVEAVRMGATTSESTGTNLLAYGVSFLNGTSAGSSAVYTLDPPISGARKIVHINTTANGPIYLKTANSETFNTTLGTSFTTIKSSAGGFYELVGLTSAVWGLLNVTSGTSSQGSGHVLTTST